MSNEYDHRKTIFLPMLCRLSIKDIIPLNHHRKNPISAPQVSCMGQVNRNNRVTSFPAAAAHHRRYSKLKRLFSGKTLLPPTTASAGGGRTRSKRKSKLENEWEQDCVKVVNIGEIDPPLPVVKRAAPPSDAANLWRRRVNGAVALKGLQIEPIITRLPNSEIISSQQPTV